MAKISISKLDSHSTALLLVGCESLDPCGMVTAQDIKRMTESGQCFAAKAEHSQAVYVLKIVNGVAWISACKGAGPVKWREVLLPIIEEQAKGLIAVGFQTKSKGLVKAAQAQGYEVTGWIMRKRIQ